MQQFVVVAQRLDQPRAVGETIDAEQRLALLLVAVGDFGEHGIVAGQNAALEVGLLAGKIAHRGAGPSTCSAISRVRSTSAISSSSGGMLSSRSIMVETRPKRLSAAA